MVKVPGKPIHAMHDDGVAPLGETEQFGRLGPARVLSRGLICKDQIENFSLELSLFVLVESAGPRLPDSLTSHESLQPRHVRLNSKTPIAACPRKGHRALI